MRFRFTIRNSKLQEAIKFGAGGEMDVGLNADIYTCVASIASLSIKHILSRVKWSGVNCKICETACHVRMLSMFSWLGEEQMFLWCEREMLGN